MIYNTPKTGCVKDKVDKRDKNFRIKRPLKFLFKRLPSVVNNISLIPTPIRNQGNEGSCCGFASTKALETAYHIHKNKQADLSERYCYELGKACDEWKGENYEGTSIRAVMKGLRKIGCCEENYWRYVPNDKLGQDVNDVNIDLLHNAKDYKIKSYHSLFGYSGKVNLWKLKKAINDYGFAVCGFALPENFGEKIIYDNDVDLDYNSGHAMLVAGYDDEKQSFIIVNSWGKEFGKNGICWFKYKLFKKSCFSAWTFSV